MTYQPTDYERALYKWLELVVGGEVTDVRYADQYAARPDRPFVTLKCAPPRLMQTAKVDTTDVELPDGTHQVRITEHRVGTVSVNVFGATHKSLIESIERSLADPFVTDHNTANGVEVQDSISQAQDLTELMSTEFEGRSQQDFRFAFAKQTHSPHGMPVLKTSSATGEAGDLTTTHTLEDT